jgi:hypothetical protein
MLGCVNNAPLDFTRFYLFCVARNTTYFKLRYSLRPIIPFANIDVSRHILVIDTSVLAKSNMGRREYCMREVYIINYMYIFLEF